MNEEHIPEFSEQSNDNLVIARDDDLQDTTAGTQDEVYETANKLAAVADRDDGSTGCENDFDAGANENLDLLNSDLDASLNFEDDGTDVVGSAVSTSETG